jgi:ornithine cyclodeaminase/alanine dehydrogenase-like protein (mu-crystallin family)
VIILTNEDVERLLDMQTCIAAIEAAFRDLGNEDAVDIPRQDAVVPSAIREAAIYDLKTMSGSWPGAGIAAVRLNSDIVTCPVVNGEARRVKVPVSEPGGRYNGSMLLFSTETGQLLCIVNDGMMQKTRVGATSGVAAKYLMRPDAKILGLLGTGLQAGGQIEAMCTVRRFDEIRVFSPTAVNRTKFVEHFRVKLQVNIRAVATPEEAVDGTDVLVTATNSLQPIVKPEWLKPGMHLSTVNRTELPPAVFAKIDRLILNARLGGQDYIARGCPDVRGLVQNDSHSKKDVVSLDAAPELKDLTSGKVQGRQSAEEITCFHNFQGLGLQFAALGSIVYREAVNRKIGLVLDDALFTQTIHP